LKEGQAVQEPQPGVSLSGVATSGASNPVR
jgi:hypothetical protein